MEAQVQRMLDERAVEKVHVRYCRGIDRFDWELVRSCFHEDSYTDYGHHRGNLDEFIAYARTGGLGFVYTMHFIGNQLVTIDDDTAWAEHYTRAYHRIRATPEAPSVDWHMALRYVDRMERRSGVWRIAHRVMLVEALHVLPISEVPDFAATFNYGIRGPGDISYDRSRSTPS